MTALGLLRAISPLREPRHITPSTHEDGMNWHRLATNPEVIEALYDDVPPALDGCYFPSMVLDERHGGSLMVALSIKQMPEVRRWPKTWWNESNRVDITLSFSSLSGVCVEGWGVWAVASVDL